MHNHTGMHTADCTNTGPVNTYGLETNMSHPKYDNEEINESELGRTFEFDKFMSDLEHRERLRREALEKLPIDHNAANRLRDARNREHLHNRLRWSK